MHNFKQFFNKLHELPPPFSTSPSYYTFEVQLKVVRSHERSWGTAYTTSVTQVQYVNVEHPEYRDDTMFQASAYIDGYIRRIQNSCNPCTDQEVEEWFKRITINVQPTLLLKFDSEETKIRLRKQLIQKIRSNIDYLKDIKGTWYVFSNDLDEVEFHKIVDTAFYRKQQIHQDLNNTNDTEGLDELF